MTLIHSDDFSIELTEDADVSNYLTNCNQTILIIIKPETSLLFTYSGYLRITGIIVANNSQGIIPTIYYYNCSLGDVNCDWDTNVQDVVIVVECALQIGYGYECYDELGDMNADGVINILDVVILVNWVLYEDD